MERYIKTSTLCIRASAIDFLVKKEIPNIDAEYVIQFFLRGNSVPNTLPFTNRDARDIFYDKMINYIELAK